MILVLGVIACLLLLLCHEISMVGAAVNRIADTYDDQIYGEDVTPQPSDLAD